MRKSVIATLLVVAMTFAFTYATAENYSEMTTDELLAIRAEINDELSARYQQPEIEDGTAIADLFPDRYLAMKVRDAIGAISTKDPITQDELDSITSISIDGATSGETTEFKDLTGIGYLQNLKTLRIIRQPECTVIPDEIGNCIYLEELDIRSSGFKTLPDEICNLIYLEKIIANYSELESLPDDIGNLESLRKLDISHTNVKALPTSIRNLTLDSFKRDGLDLD